MKQISDEQIDSLWLEHRPPGLSSEEQYRSARKFARAVLALASPPRAMPAEQAAPNECLNAERYGGGKRCASACGSSQCWSHAPMRHVRSS